MNMWQVRFYTAVGSHLDYKGVDGFFEIYLDRNRKVVINIDLTTNPKKVSPDIGVKIVKIKRVENENKVTFYWNPEWTNYAMGFFKNSPYSGNIEKDIASCKLLICEKIVINFCDKLGILWKLRDQKDWLENSARIIPGVGNIFPISSEEMTKILDQEAMRRKEMLDKKWRNLKSMIENR